MDRAVSNTEPSSQLLGILTHSAPVAAVLAGLKHAVHWTHIDVFYAETLVPLSALLGLTRLGRQLRRGAIALPGILHFASSAFVFGVGVGTLLYRVDTRGRWFRPYIDRHILRPLSLHLNSLLDSSATNSQISNIQRTPGTASPSVNAARANVPASPLSQPVDQLASATTPRADLTPSVSDSRVRHVRIEATPTGSDADTPSRIVLSTPVIDSPQVGSDDDSELAPGSDVFHEASQSFDINASAFTMNSSHILSITADLEITDMDVSEINPERAREAGNSIQFESGEHDLFGLMNPALRGHAMYTELDRLYRLCDDPLHTDKYTKCMSQLQRDHSDDPEVLWRASRLQWYLARCKSGTAPEQCKEHLEDALAFAEAGVTVDATCGACWQWLAITRGQMQTEFPPRSFQGQLQAGRGYQDALDKALLHAGDHPLTYVLEGLYSYHTAMMSWMNRRAAQATGIRVGTLESAAGHLLRAIEAAPVHDYNTHTAKFYLGKVYLDMKDQENARIWFQSALDEPESLPHVSDGAEATRESRALLAKLG